MTAILLAAVIATVWFIDGTLALVLAVAIGVTWAILASRGPAPLIREPKRPKTHRWVPGIGLGLTPGGPFPFVTIYRRRR